MKIAARLQHLTKTAMRMIADDEGEPSGLTQLSNMSDDALNTEDEAGEKDPTFDLDLSTKEDIDCHFL